MSLSQAFDGDEFVPGGGAVGRGHPPVISSRSILRNEAAQAKSRDWQ
jgi:hypothetical protein